MLTGYYKKGKEKLSKKSCERYKNFSEEEKDKKSQYARERYINLFVEEKVKKRSMVMNDIKNFQRMQNKMLEIL